MQYIDWLKYIIIQTDIDEIPIIFSNQLTHRHFDYIKNIVSAGFCKISENESDGITVDCAGMSDSLEICSRPKIDADIIMRCLKMGC